MTIVSVAIIILLFSLVEVLSECGSECIDIDPPGEYNCIEQAAFGKCSEEWMINCNCACDRCPSNTNDVVKSSKVIALKQQNDLCSGNSLQNGLEEHDLHVVIDSTQGDIIIDTDADGQQQVTLDGKASHTHQPGESITYFKWTDENGQIITEGENAQTASATIPTGEHAWNLQIFDGQQKSLSACYAFTVTSNRAVPGTLIKWYPGLKTLDFDAKSQKAKFAQFNKNLNVEPPFPIIADAVVEIKGNGWQFSTPEQTPFQSATFTPSNKRQTKTGRCPFGTNLDNTCRSFSKCFVLVTVRWVYPVCDRSKGRSNCYKVKKVRKEAFLKITR
eukprot:TRINITY_DN12723_c0_g1_i1.p3 TRINITY_DN12723_c0_g1~~TRINITY_DN12723_c0_g1_i1.p3  ORF type:complete len:332 (-),score=39.52 TRINITY_DN12723_c0_g1_i1:1055-2050(-)